MISLKPPVVPRPSMGGGPKARDDRPLHFAGGSWSSSAAEMASARQRRVAALGELVEHDVHRAQVRRVGAGDQRLAGDAHGVGDARACRGPASSICAMIRCVRSTEAESGNCTLRTR